jgi:hypothetical protein
MSHEWKAAEYYNPSAFGRRQVCAKCGIDANDNDPLKPCAPKPTESDAPHSEAIKTAPKGGDHCPTGEHERCCHNCDHDYPVTCCCDEIMDDAEKARIEQLESIVREVANSKEGKTAFGFVTNDLILSLP